MTLERFIKDFSILGEEMTECRNPLLVKAVECSAQSNPFFTPHMQRVAMKNIAEEFLLPEKLGELLWHIKLLRADKRRKKESGQNASRALTVDAACITDFQYNKSVAVIMAGNIPLVGFHDLLCVLACGCKAVVKPSSKDRYLIEAVALALEEINGEWKDYIFFTDRNSSANNGGLPVIASGSDFTAEKIEKEFAGQPMLLRKNRFSFAVLSGKETDEELKGLASDMFLYCGLGCRSVSYLLVPDNYDFTKLVAAAQEFRKNVECIPPFKNSYLHNRAIAILNAESIMYDACAEQNENEVINLSGKNIIDGYYFLLKKDASVHPPLAQVNFRFFKSADDIAEFEKLFSGRIQKKYTNFGLAQRPQILDFADGADTTDFILNSTNTER